VPIPSAMSSVKSEYMSSFNLETKMAHLRMMFYYIDILVSRVINKIRKILRKQILFYLKTHVFDNYGITFGIIELGQA